MRTHAGQAWSACYSFQVSLLEFVVLVAELTQTMCDTYGGDRSLTTGVCTECGHPVILLAKHKAVGEVRGRLDKGIKPAGSSGPEPCPVYR